MSLTLCVDDPGSAVDMVRRRSVVWGFFKNVDSESVQCVLCSSYLVRHEKGTTTNMLRHVRVKHPAEYKRIKCRVPEAASTNGHQDMETDSDQFCSVEVTLEDGDSDTVTMANDADFNSAVNSILKAAQGGPAEQISYEEASDERPVRRRRSLIWRHFNHLDSLAAAQCRICMQKLQCFEGSSTSNLRRHISTRHPKVFSQLVADEQNPATSHSSQGSNFNSDTSTAPETVGPARKRPFSVEVTLKDGGSDKEENDVNSILEAAQRGPAEQITHEEASDEQPVRRRRSLIWRHFNHLDSLAAAQCRICMKKLQFFEGRSTSNMRQHMSKRHPKVFSQLVADRHNPLPSHSSQGPNVNGDTSTSPETVGSKERSLFSDALKVSRASGGEKRLFRREQELIESLRRAQREEARALDHQRELLEKLRAANAREAAAEREQIESLRKAQQQEAKDLSRQKEELQKEKAELQTKWDELQKEREELLLFSTGQQTS